MIGDPEKTLPNMTEESFAIPTVMLKLLFDGETGPVEGGLAVRVTSQPVVVGRTPQGRGLKVSDPRVSRQHAKVWARSHGLEIVCEDMSSNGTFVNGVRVSTTSLSDGDVLRVGNSFLLVRVEPQRSDDARISELRGDSPAMAKVRRSISKIAPSEATVLINGPSGTGKELVARAVHEYSDRKGPFVPVNCAAIPLTLAESQLFGHVAGSFTGADNEHDGFFRMAEGGTLFLDEVGELPMEIQPKFLRVLEERTVMPVGGTRSFDVNVRIVAATNRELELAIRQQGFRGDLYARLAEFTIKTPGLRERIEDVLPLFIFGYGQRPPSLSPELVEALLLHTWPFNVRELFKVAAELKLHARERGRLELTDVDHRFLRSRSSAAATPHHQNPVPVPAVSSSAPVRRDVTPGLPGIEREPVPSKERIENLLVQSKGNISKLSRSLNRSRRQIYRYLEMYDLDAESYRE